MNKCKCGNILDKNNPEKSDCEKMPRVIYEDDDYLDILMETELEGEGEKSS